LDIGFFYYLIKDTYWYIDERIATQRWCHEKI